MLFRNLSTQKVWEVTNPDRIEELRASSEYQEIKQEAKKEPEETKSEEPKSPDKKSKTKVQ